MSGQQAVIAVTADNQPTPEQQAYAYVFLNDLKSNKQLAQDWQDHLDRVNDAKYPIKDKVGYLDNFLADNGYNTTAEAVLALLKVGWWNDYVRARQPNAQSDRFVQDLLQDSALYKEWAQVIQQSSEAGTLDQADQFLQGKGFDCTAIQVNASFLKMRNQNLNYWTNLYGRTVVRGADGTAQQGPAVIVYGDSTVSVGPDKLFGFTYQQGVLTWTTEGAGGLLGNPHSGKITFSQITQPRRQDGYVGDIVSGTITYPADAAGPLKGTYSLYGMVGDPPADDPSHHQVNAPPSVDKGAVKSLADTLAPYVMIGFAITMVFGAMSKVGSWGKAAWERWGPKAKESAKDAVEKTAGERPQMPEEQLEGFSESTEVRSLQQQLQETEDPAEREQIEQEVERTRAGQAEAEAEEEKGLTEEGEATGELEEVFVE